MKIIKKKKNKNIAKIKTVAKPVKIGKRVPPDEDWVLINSLKSRVQELEFSEEEGFEKEYAVSK